MEEDLEEITKEWSANLLILADLVEIFDIDSPEATQDIARPCKTKNTDEVKYLSSASVNTSSMSPEQGGDGEEIDGTEFEQRKGKVTLPRDEEDP
jgi:hypothetical protein